MRLTVSGRDSWRVLEIDLKDDMGRGHTRVSPVN